MVQTQGDKHKHRDTKRGRQTETDIQAGTERKTDKERQIDKQRQTDKERQTDRDRQTDPERYFLLFFTCSKKRFSALVSNFEMTDGDKPAKVEILCL